MAAPVLLCDTAGMNRKRWLECRAHGPDGSIPYTLGGSDAGVVLGISPWKTPRELWREKQGLLTQDDAANEGRKMMGHLLEPVAAQIYAWKTGNEVIPDTGLYQHAGYSYALANLDYRFRESTGLKGVLECKSTSFRNAQEWADGAIPYHYELQGRFYMAVMDLNFCDFCCVWGTDPDNDVAIRRITRDLTLETELFGELDHFILSLHRNVEPTMADVALSKAAMNGLARIYEKSNAALATIGFGSPQENTLRKIANLQKEAADFDTLARKKQKEAESLGVQIAEMMAEHERGELQVAGGVYRAEYITKTTRRIDRDLLKDRYPAIHDEVYQPSHSRKLKVIFQST